MQGLLALLAPDVIYWSDGGGQVVATLKPLQKAMKVARFLLAIRAKWLSVAVSHIIEINGQPGILTLVNGNVHSVTTLDIGDSCIRFIHTIRNPDKLKQITANWASEKFSRLINIG